MCRIALSFVVLLIPLLAPMPTVAQVETLSATVSGEDIEDFFRGKFERSLYDKDGFRRDINADPERPIYEGTFEHVENGCTVHSFFGFGTEANEQLEDILADRRETLGDKAVTKTESDTKTEYRFLVGDDTVVGGAVVQNELSAAV